MLDKVVFMLPLLGVMEVTLVFGMPVVFPRWAALIVGIDDCEALVVFR